MIEGSEKKSILIVDESKRDTDVLVKLLGNIYNIFITSDAGNVIELVESNKIDLILLDIMMSSINGFEICTILKSQSSTKDIPVIFVTEKIDEDSIEKAYDVGGIDYISKPFKPRELLARVKTHIKLKALIDHLEYIASHDEMTGIYNRRKFFSEALENFDTIEINLYAYMIDIDKFKNINDRYGHAFGDKVIKSIAKIISENMLEGSIFGRVGGEEFALLCHSVTPDAVLENLEYLIKTIEKEELITDDGRIVKCTISAGMARSDKDINTLDILLKRADEALYEAKDSGRNKAIFR